MIAKSWLVGAGLGGLCLTVLTSVRLVVVIRSATVASVGGVTVFIQRFEACSPIEAMSIATLHTGNFTNISKPTLGAFLLESKELVSKRVTVATARTIRMLPLTQY